MVKSSIVTRLIIKDLFLKEVKYLIFVWRKEILIIGSRVHLGILMENVLYLSRSLQDDVIFFLI